GYAPAQVEVEVAAGKSPTVNLSLKPVVYSVAVKTNVQKGRIEFGQKDEPRRVVEFTGGQASLANLRPGDYTVSLITDEVGYLPRTESLSVKADASVEIMLEKRLKAQPFTASFNIADEWALPRAWSGARGLEVNGEGLALVRDQGVRYADMQMNVNVELTGGSGVSFVVRAADERNYYLVRLGGPKSEPANKLRLFVVRNGQESLLGTRELSLFNLGNQLLFIVKVTGSRFEFFIDDNTGLPEPQSVGQISDDNNTFSSGTLGVAARPGDRAKVSQFYVCPGQCPKVTGIPAGVRLP
ncbi:MAG TPA: hypothetical protein VGV38_23935, partial [Pyrinomonadaceae bacterium]|nr:hypothetical protein [Pyrinomonadaceae bacterium]